jgi:hypothetical protein
MLVGFRILEDMLLLPVPRLDIDAYPDVIETVRRRSPVVDQEVMALTQWACLWQGIGLYGEPTVALFHVYR